MDIFAERAERFVKMIRMQNLKDGGVLVIDHRDAVELIEQALRTAYSKGVFDGYGGRIGKISHDQISRVLDPHLTSA